MEFTIEDITTEIMSTSLVAFYGEYPRGRGNYITTGLTTNLNEMFVIVNVGAEDLEDACAANIVGSTMKAMVWRRPNRIAVAYVIDERLDPIARSCWHFYNMESAVAVAVMREVGKVPTGTCICATELFKRRCMSGGIIHLEENGETQIGECRECRQRRTVITIYGGKE